MSGAGAPAAAVLLFLAACGGGGDDVAPAAWCNTTGQIIYLPDGCAEGWEGPNPVSQR